ncbi:MAG: DUF1203 domain-containing protein [Polyangiaceae bacterium]|nr:DUF1203 domain-containing protein [Polyangiaceae bacterium]
MFVIQGLDPASFTRYFTLSDAELAAKGARRVHADGPGYPCRVSLVDAAPGDELVLLTYAHHDVASPYRASGPIYVRRAAAMRAEDIDAIPPMLATRLLSVRAYDAAGDLEMADVVPGAELAGQIARMFDEPAVAYLHVHNARPGCFVARVNRHPGAF